MSAAAPLRPRTTRARIAAVLAVALAGAAVAILAACAIGVEGVDFLRALRPGTVDHAILIETRLPRVLLGAIVGAALATSGVTFQALLRNPLADPYVLGVSAGAAIVVALASALGQSGAAWTPLAAFAGALGAVSLVYTVGRVRGRFVPAVALLAGVVFNSFAGGVVVTVVMLSRPERAQDVLGWLVGTLGAAEWARVWAVAGWALGGVGVLCAASVRMNALSFGDEAAHAVGVDVARTRTVLFLAASLLTGAAVAASGPIGFVGIIVPHALRLVIGPDHRLLVPAAALGGAAFLVLADLCARLAFLRIGTEPGVGVVTALLGAPFFLALLWRRRGQRMFALVPLLLALGASGCRGREAPAAAERVDVVDQTGRALRVPRVARRVVSLAPSTTEILYALGAGGALVGVDAFSDYPPEAKTLPRLGSNLEPSLERILALQPDLVLIATTANREESARRLEGLGVPVFATRSESVAELGQTIEQVGALVGRAAAARALYADLQRRLDAVRARAAGRPRPKALVVVWSEPLVTVGPGTLAHEILELAGADNVCGDAETRFPQYPVERVLRRAPEVLVVGSHANTAQLDFWRRYPTVPAVAAGRLHAIDGDLLFRPGPRIALGAELLERLLHP